MNGVAALFLWAQGAVQKVAVPPPAPIPLNVPVAPAAPPEPSVWQTLGTMLLPYVGYLVVVPLVYFVFRRTWRELDVEALEHQRRSLATGEIDRRPLVLFVITAMVLTLQYYYDRDFYNAHVKPFLREVERDPTLLPFGLGEHVSIKLYGELYGLSWWVFTRMLGYTVIPLGLWKIFFPKDSLLDMGFRGKGFFKHSWIYVGSLLVVVPAVFAVASQPDFGNYYPFYKKCSRSWVDLVSWELQYVLQFFGLEVFFRGFWLNGLRRSMGSGAIFAMVVPYCMIHFGKPFYETCGAVIAGIFLGSLSMRTKSIYSGFLVHVTVAILMDVLAIMGKGGLPGAMYPGDVLPAW